MEDKRTCACGNICLWGSSIHTHIPVSFTCQDASFVLRDHELLSIRGESISIRRLDNTVADVHSQSCVDLTCTSCSTCIRIIANKAAVAFFVKNTSRRRKSLLSATRVTLDQNVPQQIQRFLVIHHENESEYSIFDEYDIDIDLMFSSSAIVPFESYGFPNLLEL